jgi:hypothetical protein
MRSVIPLPLLNIEPDEGVRGPRAWPKWQPSRAPWCGSPMQRLFSGVQQFTLRHITSCFFFWGHRMRTFLRCVVVMWILLMGAGNLSAQTQPGVGGVARVVEEAVPGACTEASPLLRVTDAASASVALRVCQDGVYQPVRESSPAPTTGIQTDASTILGMLHRVTFLSTTASLGLHNILCADPGTQGILLTLPPASTTTTGDYWVHVCTAGAGRVTIAPNGTDTINAANTALVLPQGLHHFVHIKLLNSAATHWIAEQSYAPNLGTWTGFGDFGSNIPCSNPGPTLRYAALFGSTVSSTADARPYLMPSARTARNLMVSIPAGVPASESVTVTLRVNGGSTALVCTATAAQTACTDHTNGVAVAADDEVGWMIGCGGGTTAISLILISAEFQ